MCSGGLLSVRFHSFSGIRKALPAPVHDPANRCKEKYGCHNTNPNFDAERVRDGERVDNLKNIQRS